MTFILPNNINMSRVQGLIKLVKQNKGSMLLSELSDQAEEEIDNLIPIINICKFLGLAKIEEDKIYLTDLGKHVNYRNYNRMIKEKLEQAEPIKTVLEIVEGSPATTDELVMNLQQKGIKEYTDANKLLLKELLINWAVRAKLIFYNTKDDRWYLKSKSDI